MKRSRCPQCSARLDALGAVACPACGAGLPALSTAPPVVSLVLGWAASLATVALPYLWLGSIGVGLGPYALGMLAYLALANSYTPSYDPHNMGLFGRWGPDNPFSWEDDRNRNARSMAVLLYPGKIVSWTLRVTWAAFGRLG